MRGKEILRGVVALSLFAGSVSGCGQSGENKKSTSQSPKPVAVEKLSEVASESTSTEGFVPRRALNENGIGVMYRSSAPEEVLDRFDAETVLSSIFNPDFLSQENLGASLQLEPLPSPETLLAQDARIRRWRTLKTPGFKLDATVEATFGAWGLGTAKVIGQVEGVFPWKDKNVAMKTGEAESVVGVMGQTFNLAGKEAIKVHMFPGRTLLGSSEIVDIVIGVSGDGKLFDGAPTSLWISPDGKFEYSIKPFGQK